MASTDQYLKHNKQYAAGEAKHKPTYPGKQPINPAKRVAVLASCAASSTTSIPASSRK
ncbi:MAG TPA: hypothetical protein VLX30_01310 [Burkholderiales bacterium]|nr:hypothetical protein [Burkholderiales bacterium]